MKKVIGSRDCDPAFEMPDETLTLSVAHVKVWGTPRAQRGH